MRRYGSFSPSISEAYTILQAAAFNSGIDTAILEVRPGLGARMSQGTNATGILAVCVKGREWWRGLLWHFRPTFRKENIVSPSPLVHSLNPTGDAPHGGGCNQRRGSQARFSRAVQLRLDGFHPPGTTRGKGGNRITVRLFVPLRSRLCLGANQYSLGR